MDVYLSKGFTVVFYWIDFGEETGEKIVNMKHK